MKFFRIEINLSLPVWLFPASDQMKPIIYVHSPNHIREKGQIGYNLLGGCDYKINYNKIETRRLEGNFQPQCKNYNKENQNDFEFQNDCDVSCIIEYYGEECYTISRPNIMVLRKNIMKKYQQKKQNCNTTIKHDYPHEICSMKCPQDCNIIYYDNHLSQYCFITNTTNLFKSNMMVQINPNGKPNMIIEYLPEMSLLSLICNFGGLLGMWLGVSILSISNDIVTIGGKILKKISLQIFIKLFHCINIKVEKLFVRRVEIQNN